MRTRAALAVALVSALVPVAGCSYLQTKAVGDEYVQATRVAAVEVLAGAGFSTRAGPDCIVSDDATSVDCSAETTTGARVEAHASGGDSDDLDAAELAVTVDGDRIFVGSIAAVLADENE